MTKNKLETLVSKIFFSKRTLWISLFAVFTVIMAYFVTQLRVDASFEKNIPLKHEYMQTYLEYQEQFGGANRVLVALEDKSGNIFNTTFFEALNETTGRVAGISGVNQPQVESLFTPNIRYIEASEQGLEGGPVIPARFDGSERALNQVRENILKAGIVGRLVSNEFESAMVSAQLLSEYNPTGDEVTADDGDQMVQTDFVRVAHDLEQIRTDIEAKYPNVEVHIIGFSKMIGDVSDAAGGVIVFFLIALAITALLVYWYSRSLKLTLLPILTSIIAVVWQLGILTALGYGIDPMSILVPFLIFAIGVSHGVQMINGVQHNVAHGMKTYNAAIAACATLIVPGGVALISDTVGFLTLQLIEIDIIRELAVTASIGVAVLILTNLLLLPLLLSYTHFSDKFVQGVRKREQAREKWWKIIAGFARKPVSTIVIVVGLLLGIIGYWQSLNMKVGDLQAGAPTLRQDSTYNQDNKYITETYAIGTDVIYVLAKTKADGCTYFDIMNNIDQFQWEMNNVKGVQSTISLPQVAKVVNGMLSEGNLKWKILPKDEAVLVQSISRVETGTGLLNSNCSIMPVMVFLDDHKAETIERLVSAVKEFQQSIFEPKKEEVLTQIQPLIDEIDGANESVIISEVNDYLYSLSRGGELVLPSEPNSSEETDNSESEVSGDTSNDYPSVLSSKTGLGAEQANILLIKLNEQILDAGVLDLNFLLATGPVGVMAATNEAVSEAQIPMMIWVYLAVTLLCLISFRSVRGTICVILPLVVVSFLAQALMSWLNIGLTVATLPVIALGVGIGVDYGIYIFSRMVGFIRSGMSVADAYFETLKLTGNAVLFTGLTLAIGVSTWLMSDLQFQADMGIMLTFMFLVNMLGAIILLPALAALLYRR
ncbi:efflux RND transporter permease subunit [Kangiella koreensis]|uniref:Putative exporter of the RND superfamily protein n=1 Tax=Kangiella koreensis (strain DSM 16069 / JCM 12317 / KCTC 12182 / SW-125) TaxID=523791 RepID=C7R6H1_KANKD|nr:MMPL family transporter [Kangiella koreensis]ACV27399.1 putative exporter of the RND superfamily protein [Kangiella koreensis DSM 16069]